MSSHHLSHIISHELTRKQFLLYLGLLFLTLSGVAGLSKALSDPKIIHKQRAATRGFGSGPYGG